MNRHHQPAKGVFSVVAVVFIAVLSLLTVATHADNKKPSDAEIANYVQIEIEIRTLTNASLQQRHAMANGTSEQRRASDDLAGHYQSRILDVFRELDSAPGKHALFGTRNSEAIAAWLSENTVWQEQLSLLDREFERLVLKYGPASSEQ